MKRMRHVLPFGLFRSYMTEQARKHKSSTSRIKKIAAEAQENAANDTDLGEADKEDVQPDLPVEA